jgi:ABC-type Fe3+-citrate transport system substrate-binding protein
VFINAIANHRLIHEMFKVQPKRRANIMEKMSSLIKTLLSMLSYIDMLSYMDLQPCKGFSEDNSQTNLYIYIFDQTEGWTSHNFGMAENKITKITTKRVLHINFSVQNRILIHANSKSFYVPFYYLASIPTVRPP